MKQHLSLKGRAIAYIDWANVYGWTKTLKREIDAAQLFEYLKTYTEIGDVRLYAGRDTHPKSEEFLRSGEKTGYKIISKPVKYILVTEVEGQKIYRRKCDFDMEICIDVHRALEERVETFIFFTGDGDFAPLYELLVGRSKQVIVVYEYYHLGREIFQIKRGIYKVAIETLEKKYGGLFSK